MRTADGAVGRSWLENRLGRMELLEGRDLGMERRTAMLTLFLDGRWMCSGCGAEIRPPRMFDAIATRDGSVVKGAVRERCARCLACGKVMIYA